MRSAVVVLSLLVGLALGKSASATYLIDPTGGTSLNSLFSITSGGATGELDNGCTAARALGFSFNFFGSPLTSVFVSTNGSVNSAFNSSNNDVGWSASTGGTQRIAPAWDDYQIKAGDAVTEKKTAEYYSITWDIHRASIASFVYHQQALLIGAGTTIQGFPFLAGDIAFSYNGMDAPFSGATVGLRQSASVFSVPPSGLGVDADGRITSYANPLYSTGNSFVLFRDNGAGGYTVTLEAFTSVVPEPGSLALLGLGGVALALRLRKRR